jgi:hypothetical protein
MSGGGGGGGGVPDQPVDCAAVKLTTVLASPDSMVLPTPKANDQLELRLREGTPPVVVAVTSKGAEAGAIAVSNITRLIDCMRQGYRYVAVIVSVSGGEVRVTIRPASGT